MFTYIDPAVRERLVADGKLTRIDRAGARLDEGVAPPPGETVLNLLGPIPLPLRRPQGEVTAQWYASVRRTELKRVEELATDLRRQGGQTLFASLTSSMAVNSVLLFGEPAAADSPLVRVHSSCLTGDVLGSMRCECGPQLEAAIDRIAEEGSGIIVYMAGHEGRGIGLWAKAATYLLQDAGENTYQANRSLGLPDDSRDFSDAAALLLHFLGKRPFRLLTNNPKKVADLTAMGLESITAERHVFGVDARNRRYLKAKRDWGHHLDDEDIG
ncbi:MAG: GTP cyclohydrolase II [Pseudomonadota bacterium]